MRGAPANGVCEPPGEYAKRLRRDQTVVERKLWLLLRDRRLGGAKFRRQHPIGPFIADFCCPSARLVIEVDGGQHANRKREDARRTTFLQAQGFRVVRFWDNDVLANIEGVLQGILDALGHPHPGPLPGWERE